MDLSQKKSATQNTIDQPASGHSSSSSSGNDSPDPASRASRASRFQTSSKFSKNTAGSKIVEPVPTMLNVPSTENHKSSTSTTFNNEEESRVEVSGKVTNNSCSLDE